MNVQENMYTMYFNVFSESFCCCYCWFDFQYILHIIFSERVYHFTSNLLNTIEQNFFKKKEKNTQIHSKGVIFENFNSCQKKIKCFSFLTLILVFVFCFLFLEAIPLSQTSHAHQFNEIFTLPHLYNFDFNKITETYRTHPQ